MEGITENNLQNNEQEQIQQQIHLQENKDIAEVEKMEEMQVGTVSGDGRNTLDLSGQIKNEYGEEDEDNNNNNNNNTNNNNNNSDGYNTNNNNNNATADSNINSNDNDNDNNGNNGKEKEEEEEEEEEEENVDEDDIIGNPIVVGRELTSSNVLELLGNTRLEIQKLVKCAETTFSDMKSYMGTNRELQSKVTKDICSFYKRLNSISNAFNAIKRDFVIDAEHRPDDIEKDVPQPILSVPVIKEHFMLEEANNKAVEEITEYYKNLIENEQGISHDNIIDLDEDVPGSNNNVQNTQVKHENEVEHIEYL